MGLVISESGADNAEGIGPIALYTRGLHLVALPLPLSQHLWRLRRGQIEVHIGYQ